MKLIIKNRYYIFIIIFIVYLLFFFAFHNRDDLNVLNDKKLIFLAYSDKQVGGTSQCEYFLTKQNISYKYKLIKGNPFPFAGINIKFNEPIILNDKDAISFKIKTDKKAKIHIALLMEIDKGDSIWIEAPAFLKEGYNEYSLNFMDFEIPNWWISQANPNDNQITAKPNKIKVIAFSHNHLNPIGIEETISISNVTLYNSNYKLKIAFSGLFLFLFLLGLILEIKIRNKKKIILTYKSVDTNDYVTIDIKNQNLKEIVEFISNNYQDSELTLNLIRKKLKITENNISQIIKTNFNLGFNDYVNLIRLQEAKKLLKESNLNVNEIADITGFGSVSSFNRIFKNKEGISPTTFRKALIVK